HLLGSGPPVVTVVDTSFTKVSTLFSIVFTSVVAMQSPAVTPLLNAAVYFELQLASFVLSIGVFFEIDFATTPPLHEPFLPAACTSEPVHLLCAWAPLATPISAKAPAITTVTLLMICPPQFVVRLFARIGRWRTSAGAWGGA